MRSIKAGVALAGLALLASCGQSAAPPPEPSRSPQAAAPPTLRAPVAAAPSESGAPELSASASETATPTPSPAASSKPAAYPPRDECAKLPGFAAFRAKVFAAAKARDAAALAALADPAIHLDFGGGAGVDELKKRLSARDAPLWGEIDALAGLGCAADKGVATLPWIFARVPESADPYKTMWVTGAEVALRRKASASAAPTATLSWALVTLAGTSFDPKAPFAEVVTADGTRGFVATAQLRSILDYRLIADRQGGEWRIAALIAGD